MIIKMIVKKVSTGYQFSETYTIDDSTDPTDYANSLIDSFNRTLRVDESPRELVSVEVTKLSSVVGHNHDWEKQNLITIVKSGNAYDIMKCSRCNVTGKRYGIGGEVRRDSKYKAKIYNTCESAINQIEKLGR